MKAHIAFILMSIGLGLFILNAFLVKVGAPLLLILALLVDADIFIIVGVYESYKGGIK